jgi:hypothetical protein
MQKWGYPISRLKGYTVQDYDAVYGVLGHDMVKYVRRVSLYQKKFLPSFSGYKILDHTVSHPRRPQS